ncbi:MAG: phage holin family protein [Candidatus Moranbacteria bacterium]|nr:phage holin family protein [Candidatus Moranbacteria bacterium]
MKKLFSWILAAVSVIVVAYLIPGVSISGLIPALALALIIGIFNLFIKPVLNFLTLPVNLFTFGLVSFLINTLFILIAAFLVPGFQVEGFLAAMLFVIFLSVTNSVLGFIFK